MSTRHEITLHDGAKVVVKHWSKANELNAHGGKLQNAFYVVQFFKSKLTKKECKFSYIDKKRPIHKVYWDVKIDAIDWTPQALDRILGTLKLTLYVLYQSMTLLYF